MAQSPSSSLEEREHPTEEKTHAQQERLLFLGMIASGLAHELNNPIAYVQSNLHTLTRYIDKLVSYTKLAVAGENLSPGQDEGALAHQKQLKELHRDVKLDAVLADLGDLLQQTISGVGQMQKLVQGIRNFARQEEGPRPVAINELCDEVLGLLRNELKHKLTISKNYGEIPTVDCWTGELMQSLTHVLLGLARTVSGQGVLHLQTTFLGDQIKLVFSMENLHTLDEESKQAIRVKAKGIESCWETKSASTSDTHFVITLPLGVEA